MSTPEPKDGLRLVPYVQQSVFFGHLVEVASAMLAAEEVSNETVDGAQDQARIPVLFLVRLHEQRVKQHPEAARIAPKPGVAAQAPDVLALLGEGQFLPCVWI